MTLPGITISRFENGRIAEDWDGLRQPRAPSPGAERCAGWRSPCATRPAGSRGPEAVTLVLLSLSQAAEGTSEEDERVFAGRDVQLVDLPDDDPVIPGGVLGDDLALEGGEGVGEQW